MTSAETIRTQLFQGLPELVHSQINLVTDSDSFDWSTIKKGLVSVHATWSGQSIFIGLSIMDALKQSGIAEIEVHIIDIDRLSQTQQFDLFGKPCHGYFESVWIENGAVKMNTCRPDADAQLERLKTLIAQPT